MPLTCVPRPVSSILFPVPLDKGNVGNEVSGSGKKNRLPHRFLLDISLTFPLIWFFLHFTASLRFTFCILHPVFILPLDRSLQSAVHILRFTLTKYIKL